MDVNRLAPLLYLTAGKVREAGQLCCQAGQAWRCLSLAGGGAWGPLPVGEAAAEAAQQVDQQVIVPYIRTHGTLPVSGWLLCCFAGGVVSPSDLLFVLALAGLHHNCSRVVSALINLQGCEAAPIAVHMWMSSPTSLQHNSA